MSYQLHFADIKLNIKRTRYENELEVLYLQEPKDIERIHIIENILQELRPVQKEQLKDTFFKEIDKIVFKKTWNRLQSFHRLIKMNEYLESHYKGEPYYNKLVSEFKVLIESGKLSTKKSVVYDPKKECIESLPCLSVVKNVFTIKN